MIAAHMDEIGVMATFAEPKSGYLRFAAMGGLINTTLLGNRVYFEDGTVGVIGLHDYFGAGRTSVTNLDDFFIDVSDGERQRQRRAGDARRVLATAGGTRHAPDRQVDGRPDRLRGRAGSDEAAEQTDA